MALPVSRSESQDSNSSTSPFNSFSHFTDRTSTDTPLTTPNSSSFTHIGANGSGLDEDVIPQKRVGDRNLVLCFDGTGDQFDSDNSNIVQLFSMLKKDDRSRQMVYYQAGIGTYTVPQIATPIATKVSKTVDTMIAWNLDAHVMSGYEFLMQNYQGGDKICIFGFSRGAYTARALAGMIHKVGLLPPSNNQQIPFAYKMYTQADEKGWEQSTAFKKAFSIDVEIEFLGVWDTVCSVGLIPRTLPFTTSNTAVRYFRHALSMDERRVKFKQNGWNIPNEDERKLGTKPGEMPISNSHFPRSSSHASALGSSNSISGLPSPPLHTAAGETGMHVDGLPLSSFPMEKKAGIVNGDKANGEHKGKVDNTKQGKSGQALEREFSKDYKRETDVLEVWFAGCHCDVGGGSVDNGTPHSLARIPLRWMIRQAFLCNSGIMFHASLLRTVGLDPASLYPVVKERPRGLNTYEVPQSLSSAVGKSAGQGRASEPGQEQGKNIVNNPFLSEEEEDVLDGIQPIYDQLSLAWFWWVLEVLPTEVKYQDAELGSGWLSQMGMHLGRPRTIHGQKKYGLRVHRTVKMRMDAEGLQGGKYVPRPHFRVDPIWVD